MRAIYLDVGDLHTNINRKFPGRRLNFRKLLEIVGSVDTMIAYGAQVETEATKFIDFLGHVGFTCKFKRPKSYETPFGIKHRRQADWGVGITVDVMLQVDRLKEVYLGTSDEDALPLICALRERAIEVVVIGAHIPESIAEVANATLEVEEHMLEVPRT